MPHQSDPHCRTSTSTARACSAAAAIAVLSLVVPAGVLAPDARAAIVCRHARKAQRVRVEAGPECRKRAWVKVADLGDISKGNDVAGVGEQVARLDAQVDGLGALVTNELGAQCARDPAKTLVARRVAGSPPALVDGCRAHDGDQAACLGSFQVSGGEPFSCWYYGGRCLPCTLDVQSTLACVNACEPPACTALAGRRFAGGPFTSACSRFTDQTTCEQYFELSYGLSDAVIGPRPATSPAACWWNGSFCRGCIALDVTAGSCPSCVPLPQCASRPGPPSRCAQALGQQDCEQRYELLPQIWGWAASCFWNAQASQCGACGLTSQFADGACTNEC